MSLINQVLCDLESRRAVPATVGGVAPLALAAQREAGIGAPAVPVQVTNNGQSGSAQRWLIVIIVLLMLMLGLLLWSSQPPWQGAGSERMPPLVTAEATEPVARVPVVSMSVKPVAPVAVVATESVEPTEPVESTESTVPIVATPLTVRPAVVERVAAEPLPRRARVGLPPSQPSLSPKPSPVKEMLPAQMPAADMQISMRIRPLDNEQRAEQALHRGVGLLGQGRQAEAEQALREAVRLAPRSPRAHETLAALYFNSGRLTEAQTLLADGVRLSPRAAGLAQLYARLLAEQGELATALTVLQRASPPLTENLDYHALLAALYQRDGRHQPAVWVYRQLLAQRGTQATWWMGLGISLEALDDSTSALEAYLKAHQLGAGLSPQVLDYLGSRIRVLAPRVAAAKTVVEMAKGEE
ncbi:hypothetical protein MNBD_GAMMA20-1546 [hydrothermal vent metagenome]|uniref:Uncharacterized protein n=1 Tax=hydrothermal vent metagenome TaxID=652676 RepID=A0A3B1AW48_9ZZZZ